MSKRFGRNQKRKSAARIADLQQSVAMANGLSSHLTGQLQAARDTINEMIQIIESVSYYSAAIPAKEMVGDTSRSHVRLEQHDTSFFTPPDSFALHTQTFRNIDLYAFRAYVEEHKEQFQSAVHLKYSTDRHSAYMLSEIALKSMPKALLIERVIPDIAGRLIDHLRSAA